MNPQNNQKPYNQNTYNQNRYNQNGYGNQQYIPYSQPGYYYPPQQLSPEQRQSLQQYAYYQQKRSEEKRDLIIKGLVFGATILAYLFIQVIVTGLLSPLGLMDEYESSPLFQNCINIIAVHLISMSIPFTLMAVILKKKSERPLVPTKKIGGLQMFSWVFLGLGMCMGANFITSLVINLCKTAGYELTQPELAKSGNIYEYIALVFSTAIVPAIFEEYAFRCCTMSVLKPHGKAFSVIAVSIVFGLVHGNVIQFVFAFLVGCVLGYITLKTDSVIPAMLIHGLNNLNAVITEIVTSEAGKKTADTVLTVIVAFYILFAILGAIYLFYHNLFLLGPEQKKKKLPYGLKLGEQLLCLLPGLALPIAILIYLTSQFVNKI